MKFIQTEKQQLLSPRPTKLNTLREIDKRMSLEQHMNYKKQLYRLEKGQEGEERLVHYLKEYGAPHWTIARNIWLEYYGEFECDLLLFTNAGPYAFEIKNYSGKLELQSNQCLLNGKAIGNNPFTQTQKVMANLNDILRTPHLQGVLAFVGENNHVQMHDPVSGIEVRMLNELQHYIWKIAQQERNTRTHPIDTAALLQTLDRFKIGKPTKEQDLPGEIKTGVRRGIRCCHCNNFNLKINRTYIICPCGMHEPREEAIVRTICEYGVIYSERELTTNALTDFFDGDISESTVFRHLTKHFKRVGKYKNAQYTNPRSVLEKNRHAFELTQPKYMRLH